MWFRRQHDLSNSLSRQQLSLLCGIVTTLPDRLPGDSEALDALEEQHDAHLRALQEYELDKRRSKPNALAKILLRLLDVRAIALREAGRLILTSRPEQLPGADVPVEGTGYNPSLAEYLPEEHPQEAAYVEGHATHPHGSYIHPKLEPSQMYQGMPFDHQHQQSRLQHQLPQHQQPARVHVMNHQQQQQQQPQHHHHHQQQQQHLYYHNPQQDRQTQHQVMLDREEQQRIMKALHERQHGLHMLPGRQEENLAQESRHQQLQGEVLTHERQQQQQDVLEDNQDDSEG